MVLVLTCIALLELAFQYGTRPEAYKAAAASDSLVQRDIYPRQTSVASTLAAATTDYIAVATPTEQCYVTATVVEVIEMVFSDGSTVPTTTAYSTNVPTGTGGDCSTVTMIAVSTSYMAIASPSASVPEATTSGVYDAISSPATCYVTATVVEILSVYSADGSATVIATSLSTNIGTATAAGCTTEYMTTTSVSYLAIQSATTVQSAYVANASPSASHVSTAKSTAQYSYVTLAPAPSSTSPTEGSSTIEPVSQISDGEPQATYAAIVTPSSATVVSSVAGSASSSTFVGDASGAKISYMAVSTGYTSFVSTGDQPTQFVTVIAMQPSPANPTRTALVAVSSTSSTAAVLPTLAKSQLQLGKHFNNGDYFLASYLAVFVAVALKELWSVVFASTKMMEPFYQLQQPGGASASNSLLANYLSTWLSWKSVQAVFGGQWVMMFSTITYAFFASLSPIATECMETLPTAWCSTADDGRQPCLPVWLLNKPFARALEAVLSAIALFIILLILINFRRKSGLHSNPSSLASMAALLNNEEVIEEIRALDPYANDKSIAKALTGSAYKIEYHNSLNGTHHYGLVKPDSLLSGNYDRYGSMANPHNMSLTNHAPARGTFASRALRDSLFLIIVCALFGVVLGYYLDHSPDPFNQFFNSGTFGPRFLLTSMAVLVGLHWKTLEREVRILTPYRRLSQRNARPENTILVTLNGTPLTALPGALRRGDVFHATIAFVAICSDLLIIAIAGVPFNRSQVWKAFIASAASSLTILGMMILAIFGLFWWRIQNERMRMPREPDTLIAVCMMLCNEGNGVRRMMEGMELLEEKVRDVRVKEEGGVFYAGEVHDGMGGRGRWVVDVGDAAEGKVVGYG